MNGILNYANGLNAVVCEMKGVRSVAAGIWVRVGSNCETSANNGLSHFTEHMMFKGTDKLSPFDIANKFESYGANVNAFTGKECTCYYAKYMDEYGEECFSLLTDIFFSSVFPPEELDKERKVIVEEINMNEDSPEDLCYDELAAAVFGDRGLGRTILGPIENVMRFTKKDVDEFVGNYYSPENVVVAFAGNITMQRANELMLRYVLPRFDKKYPHLVPEANVFNRRVCRTKIKPFEQANLAISFPSLPFAHRDSATLAALNVVLGGGMSSRLFQSIREQQGLAYSVYTSPGGYTDAGTFNVVLNISEKNTTRVLEAVKKELDLFVKEGLTDEELARTKAQLKSSLVFSGESVQSVMSACGKLMLLKGELYDADAKIAQIDAVTRKGVLDMARATFDYSAINAAYVGKKTDADILGAFGQ